MPVDRGLALLNQYGYNLVQRHDVRLAPLDVLGRDDILERIGSVGSLFAPSGSLPPPTREPASAFNGQRTGNVHISLAVRMLVHMLNGLGGAVRLDALDEFSKSVRFVQFEFANVVNVGLTPFDVARWLQSAPVQQTTMVERYLLNPDADGFVVTDVMESDTVRVLPLELGDEPVRLNIQRLRSMFGSALRISMDQDWIECRGAAPATLAFKCFRLERAPQGWSLAGSVSDPGVNPALIAPGTRVLVRAGPAASL